MLAYGTKDRTRVLPREHQATVITNMLDYGMDPQAALDAPRASFEGDVTILETSIPDSVALELQRLGHVTERRNEPLGCGQIIAIDREAGVLKGASDPRKDGVALGY